MSPDSPRAVFLSYAREDTDAARRIADALRAFGLEVWFDQSELRGGDAWDAKIKKQIRECALFVPVVSAHSQQRHEGYFRREWKLAVERTHDMAAGVAFIVPVVVDETSEAEAIVPEEFLRYQWTHLPHGVPSPEFVGQVQRLLEAPRGAAAQRPEVRSQRSEAGNPPAERSAPKRSGLPGWAWGVLIVIVAGAAVAVFSSRRTAPAARPLSLSPSSPPAVDAKSIAVLPFENMSADQGNAYFCDGVQEDILTNLANIHELRVVSRTSVEQYRNTTKSIREIAQELGVKWILEGSVQRAGNQVRVTGQLINAATDEHVWAKAYDRDITDIFAIQSELAQTIASSLQAAISPAEQSLLDRKRTTNPAAYDLYLRARQESDRAGITVAATNHRITLLESAVDLDPSFAAAWGELADAHAFAYFSNYEGMDAHLAKAKAAIDRAVSLAPDDPDVIEDLGTYYYYGYRDYARAIAQYERLAQARPNDAGVFNALALIQRRQGRWAESLANSRRATGLDPANIGYLRNLESTLTSGNRWAEAIATQRRIAELVPDSLDERYALAEMQYEVTGSRQDVDAFFGQLTPAQAASPRGIWLRKQWAVTAGDLAEAIRLDREQPYFDEEGLPHAQQAFQAAMVLAANGDRAAVAARLAGLPAELRARLVTEPNNAFNWAMLAGMEALLGQREAADRDADHGAALIPPSRDALVGPVMEFLRAAVHGWLGEKDRAIPEVARLVLTPGGPSVQDLRFNPLWYPLRDDPRIQALIKDPKYREPLF